MNERDVILNELVQGLRPMPQGGRRWPAHKRGSVKVLVHPGKDSVGAIATLLRSLRSVRAWKRSNQAGEVGLSVLGPSMRSMTRYVDEDLHGAEFRECDLTGARLIGVVMQDAVIDGLSTNLVPL
ncbi:pentapeptide repeat protein [Streptomyces sp. 846.5]|nr:pentapeptide repeat-containing protein [Streptomyces sp. 846.5]TDU01649.1 pentapeptide repeat protein [Streptomyces sp. 846.5]